MVSEVVSPAERQAPGQHLVQHAAEGPDVGALVHGPAARLFRTHVGRRPDDEAVARPIRGDGRRLRQIETGRVTGRGFGQAEVEHLHRAGRRDHDIGRLQVAVDDSPLVRRIHRVGDLPREGQCGLRPSIRADGDLIIRSSVSPGTNSMTSAWRPSLSSSP